MNNRDRRPNERRPKQNKFKKKNDTRRKKEGVMAKKCPYCDSEMKARGASDCSGGQSWKCRNKKCGRTVWTHNMPKSPPEPLVPEFLSIGV